MKIKDYVIAVNKNIPGRYRVVSIEGGHVRLLDLKTPHIKKEIIEVGRDAIIVNLGPKPYVGPVGFDFTTVYRGRSEVPKLGLELNWFYKPEPDVRMSLERAFRIAHKRLTKLGLNFLLEDDFTVWEINPATKQKYAGMYIHSKVEHKPSRLIIRPEMMTAPDYPYVIAHELGHRIHFAYLDSAKVNSSWLRLYEQTVQVRDVTSKESKNLLQGLLSGEDKPSSFGKTLEDDETKAAYRTIVRYISQNKGMNIRELDVLFISQDHDVIESVWPQRSLPVKELAPLVTEYATKNFRELLAESFAYYVVGKKLPKAVNKLVEATIVVARQAYKDTKK